MSTTRRTLLAAACALAIAPAAHAQAYPDRPVKILYTYAPGGPGDALTRLLATHMGPLLGQPVVVENRTGASGGVGVMAAARSPADGYTFLLTTITTVVQIPMVMRDNSFDPVKSLTQVANVATQPLVLVAHPSVPANDFLAFVEWMRKQPEGVHVAVSGPTLEVASALVNKGANIKMVNVPYRGAAPAFQALLGGEVKLYFTTPSAALLDFVKQGKVKVLGVTSAQASPLIPGAEPIGKYVPGYVQDINFAVWGPPGVPEPVMAKVTESIRKAMAVPEMAEKLGMMGMTPAHAEAAKVVSITQHEAANIKRAMEIATIRYGE
ncbi:tripartite tricarboxylate transporter substrate binding protein [Hydrogenophaga sp.]|uniref:Bug family tripartite tricarboxylate transporter substrate binding protein n=1 Tax=Hydrogenophaga sp. TaxID=1904254 RepID=UPI002621F965|nr:tripartite tricarboxylate transporter substrate binding protein [Hydrogenophaga sp.]MCW5654356.1 tripartite tricarboxylate transporter substrate binding protein [Hydrogenophaga sp.]